MVMNLGITSDSESMPKELEPCSPEYNDQTPYWGSHGRTGSDHYNVSKEQPSSVHSLRLCPPLLPTCILHGHPHVLFSQSPYSLIWHDVKIRFSKLQFSNNVNFTLVFK